MTSEHPHDRVERPFDQLRMNDTAVAPPAHFAAALRARLAAALEAAALPVIDLPQPERSTIMSDTTTTTPAPGSATEPAVGRSVITPYLCATSAAEADRLVRQRARRGRGRALRRRRRPRRSRHAPRRRRRVVPLRRVSRLRRREPGDARRHDRVASPRRARRRCRLRTGGRPGRPRRPPTCRPALRRPLLDDRRPLRAPLDDQHSDREPDRRRDQRRDVELHRHARNGAGRRVDVGAGRARLLHAAESRNRPGVTLLRRTVRLDHRARRDRRGVRPRQQHPAAVRVRAGRPWRYPAALLPGRRPGGRDGAVGELGGTVVEQSESPSGIVADCRDDQGERFQLWQPAPGYRRSAIGNVRADGRQLTRRRCGSSRSTGSVSVRAGLGTSTRACHGRRARRPVWSSA